jgi:hypothetical protein
MDLIDKLSRVDTDSIEDTAGQNNSCNFLSSSSAVVFWLPVVGFTSCAKVHYIVMSLSIPLLTLIIILYHDPLDLSLLIINPTPMSLHISAYLLLTML